MAEQTGWERFVNSTMKAEGRHRFVSHLVFHRGSWKTAHMPAQAERFIRPPEVFPLTGKGGKELPSSFSFFSVSPLNLNVTSFRKVGNYYLLRFYETEGKRTAASIRFFRKAEKVAKTDMENLKPENIPVKGNYLKFNVSPREIVSLKVRFS